ncbi:MAG TPA: hypothetical protein VIH93_15770 [Thermoanaerobaculia bacterium]
MRRMLLGIAAAAALATSAALPARADGHRVISTQTTRIGRFVRTDWTVQAGANPLNRFHVVRLTQGSPDADPRATLVLLPPLGNGFSFFEVDENGDYARSFAAYFAERGIEVWGYSPRTTGLVAGVCESGAIDCSAMAGWGLQAVVEDAAFLRGWIGRRREPVLVGGYSLGAFSTIATIDAHPHDWDGALILEGSLYTADPAVVALNAPFCAALEAQLAAGQIFDDTTLPGIRGLVALAANDPHGPTPLPGFPPGTTNHQVMVFFLSLPQPGPLWPTSTFIRCAGSVPEDRFFYATDARVIAHSSLFNDYYDNRSIRDLSCSLAGERTFTSHLAAFRQPVYFLGGGLGFLALEDDLATLLGSTDVTRNFNPLFGHADHWFSADHRQILEGDILRWLQRVERDR